MSQERKGGAKNHLSPLFEAKKNQIYPRFRLDFLVVVDNFGEGVALER